MSGFIGRGFGNSLGSLLVKAAEKIENRHSSSSNSSNYPGNPVPPPIPHSSKPGGHAPPVPPHPHAAPPPYHPGLYWSPSLTSGDLTSVFRHELGATGWGNNEVQDYTNSASNSSFSPNGLIVRAIAQNGRYTSARLTSHATLARDRGSLRIRLTAPIAPGIWPAVWLLPQDPFSWPTDGEVDIFETWDGDAVNHSCLHWGHYNGEDWDKHRVMETPLSSNVRQGAQGVMMEFAWEQDGRVVWYVDGRAVMKGNMPRGARLLRDFRLIINIAMGGNVCKGRLPAEGTYEMCISELTMWDEPSRGWQGFEGDWRGAPEGHP